ncbi:MAG TPA: endopeptidase La, partial [Clostridiales bacterium]|nr:endopeptidase La [Clostridiales bacterium]
MENKETKILPVLVLRGRTMFPNISFSFDVGRKMSLYAVEKAVTNNTELFVCTQKNSLDDNPSADDLYTTGVICRLVKLNGIGDKNVRLQIEGLYRGKTTRYFEDDGLFGAEVMRVDDIAPAPIEERAYHSVAREKLNEYAKIAPKISSDLVETLLGVENPSEFVNILAFNLNIKESDKQAVLEEVMLAKRLELISSELNSLAVNAQLEKEIADRVKESVEKNQKEYYLREQLKAIHGELGDDEAEVTELREKILAKKMPEESEKKVLKELDRMSRMPSSSPDYTVLRTYVDWIIDLPFTTSSTDRESLDEAIKILDEDHFGLEKVKERIVEYLAVMKLTGKVGGSILCFVGPPGVGKTSVATSIARALDRKFVRISLGGVKDEAEIRGHR